MTTAVKSKSPRSTLLTNLNAVEDTPLLLTTKAMNSGEQEVQRKWPHRNLIVVAAVVTFGGNFAFGYNTIINPAIDVFRNFLNDCYVERYDESISDQEFSLIWAAAQALVNVGAILGIFAVPILTENTGRKWALIISNIPTVCSCLLMFASHKLLSHELFLFGRMLWGVNMGLNTAVIGLFLTEISPSQFRGSIAALQELSLCLVCTLGILLGMPELIGRGKHLDAILLLPLIPATLQSLALLFCHESPKHLLITLNKVTAANKAILFYHGPNANLSLVKATFQKEKDLQSLETFSLRTCIQDPGIRRGIAIGVIANVANVLTGIASYFAFSTDMFLKAGLGLAIAKYGTLLLTGLNSLATIGTITVIDRFGRRVMLLTSLSLCITCNVLYLIFAEVADSTCDNPDEACIPAYLATAAMILFGVSFGLGSGPIPWFITSELVPQAARSTAQSVAMSANWIGQLMDVFAFYPLFYLIGPYSALILHVLPSILLVFALYWFMPETKGRDISDIMLSQY